MTPGWGVACLMHVITYTAAYGGDKSYSMCTACKAKQEKQFLVVHGVQFFITLQELKVQRLTGNYRSWRAQLS